MKEIALGLNFGLRQTSEVCGPRLPKLTRKQKTLAQIDATIGTLWCLLKEQAGTGPIKSSGRKNS